MTHDTYSIYSTQPKIVDLLKTSRKFQYNKKQSLESLSGFPVHWAVNKSKLGCNWLLVFLLDKQTVKMCPSWFTVRICKVCGWVQLKQYLTRNGTLSAPCTAFLFFDRRKKLSSTNRKSYQTPWNTVVVRTRESSFTNINPSRFVLRKLTELLIRKVYIPPYCTVIPEYAFIRITSFSGRLLYDYQWHKSHNGFQMCRNSTVVVFAVYLTDTSYRLLRLIACEWEFRVQPMCPLI